MELLGYSGIREESRLFREARIQAAQGLDLMGIGSKNEMKKCLGEELTTTIRRERKRPIALCERSICSRSSRNLLTGDLPKRSRLGLGMSSQNEVIRLSRGRV